MDPVLSPGQSITLERASPRHGAVLAEISRRAFEADVEHGAPSRGGPPGYDSDKWQMRMMFAGKYFRVLYGRRLVGGCIVFDLGGGQLRLGRLFVDPAYQGRGIGRLVMRRLDLLFPDARRWSLDTPLWNRRTQRFYEALGYRKAGRRRMPGGPVLVLYERRPRQRLRPIGR